MHTALAVITVRHRRDDSRGGIVTIYDWVGRRRFGRAFLDFHGKPRALGTLRCAWYNCTERCDHSGPRILVSQPPTGAATRGALCTCVNPRFLVSLYLFLPRCRAHAASPPWHPPSRSLRLSCVSSSTPPWSNTTTVVAYIPPSPRATFSLSSSRSLALFPCLVPLLLARPHFLSFLVFLYVISGLLETFYLLFSSSRMARGCWLGKGEGESHCHGVSFRVDKGRRLDSIWSPVLDQRTRISMKIKLVESMKDSEKNGWMSSTRGWAKVWN